MKPAEWNEVVNKEQKSIQLLKSTNHSCLTLKIVPHTNVPIDCHEHDSSCRGDVQP